MSWSRHGSRGHQGRSGYHHGNLKEALVEAALELIAARGPRGFTFAEAARFAGVSPAAPYRHYRDRDALMADVAEKGFAEFEVALAQAWEQGLPDPIEALTRLGRAYLDFARSRSGLFTAMFEAGIPPDATPALRDAADRAFAVLRRAAEAVTAILPADRRPPALMVALHVWSMAQGVASLFGRDGAARQKSPMAADDLLEAGVLVYLQGAGLGASPGTESAAKA